VCEVEFEDMTKRYIKNLLVEQLSWKIAIQFPIALWIEKSCYSATYWNELKQQVISEEVNERCEEILEFMGHAKENTKTV
jgi:hypothetical protein